MVLSTVFSGRSITFWSETWIRTGTARLPFLIFAKLHDILSVSVMLGNIRTLHSTTTDMSAFNSLFLEGIFQDCGAATLQLSDVLQPILHQSPHQVNISDSTAASSNLWKLIKVPF
ncbi:hypothetical protein M5K25_019328 [Dendrobium thyrsiflorum]|uniref:Uncharacterized protein n=1 Tax=Dendrobium thyrsiflorum TaxID=117978 RepID=A0ABD0UF40_DENTH